LRLLWFITFDSLSLSIVFECSIVVFRVILHFNAVVDCTLVHGVVVAFPDVAGLLGVGVLVFVKCVLVVDVAVEGARALVGGQLFDLCDEFLRVELVRAEVAVLDLRAGEAGQEPHDLQLALVAPLLAQLLVDEVLDAEVDRPGECGAHDVDQQLEDPRVVLDHLGHAVVLKPDGEEEAQHQPLQLGGILQHDHVVPHVLHRAVVAARNQLQEGRRYQHLQCAPHAHRAAGHLRVHVLAHHKLLLEDHLEADYYLAQRNESETQQSVPERLGLFGLVRTLCLCVLDVGDADQDEAEHVERNSDLVVFEEVLLEVEDRE